jgi:hypothetical protein
VVWVGHRQHMAAWASALLHAGPAAPPVYTPKGAVPLLPCPAAGAWRVHVWQLGDMLALGGTPLHAAAHG